MLIGIHLRMHSRKENEPTPPKTRSNKGQWVSLFPIMIGKMETRWYWLTSFWKSFDRRRMHSYFFIAKWMEKKGLKEKKIWEVICCGPWIVGRVIFKKNYLKFVEGKDMYMHLKNWRVQIKNCYWMMLSCCVLLRAWKSSNLLAFLGSVELLNVNGG